MLEITYKRNKTHGNVDKMVELMNYMNEIIVLVNDIMGLNNHHLT